MRLFFIFPIEGPVNGVKVISRQVLERFRAQNIDCRVIDTSQAKSYAAFGKFDFRKILSMRGILHKMRDIRPGDAVYMNCSTKGFSLRRDLLLLRLLRLRKANVTIHIHANGLENVRSKNAKRLLSQVKIIVINERQVSYLEAFPNVRLLENALPDYYTEGFTPSHSTDGTYRLLFISNLSVPKGVDRLWDICALLKEQNRKAHVTVCGGILDDYSRIKMEEILDAFDFVTFNGPVEDVAQKMQYYRENDFLLFLSDAGYEVFPLVYIEALMNGMAVITTHQAVSGKITKGGTGMTLEQDDLPSFLNRYADGSELRALKQACRDKFENEFHFDAYVEKLKKIIFDGL